MIAMENDFDLRGKNEKKPQENESVKGRAVAVVPCQHLFSTSFQSHHALSS
jgi:hypothetical protein